MNTQRILAVLALSLTGVFAAVPASAGGHGHGGHGHVAIGVGIGLGYPYWGWPGYYGYYPYYYPPYAYYPGYYPPYASAQSQVYVEQPQAQPAQPSGYWYYCADSRAYYPYVKECPAGWHRVAPQPQN